jgi:hypothetical protein
MKSYAAIVGAENIWAGEIGTSAGRFSYLQTIINGCVDNGFGGFDSWIMEVNEWGNLDDPALTGSHYTPGMGLVDGEVIKTVVKTFAGTVQPVTAGPRPVTVVITPPTGAVITLPAVNTDAQGAFTTTKDLAEAVGYKAQASTPADSKNKAGQSSIATFDVSAALADTVVTLTVS